MFAEQFVDGGELGAVSARGAIEVFVELANSVFMFVGAIKSPVLSDTYWFAAGVIEFLMQVRFLYVYLFNVHVERGCNGKQEFCSGFLGHI